MIKKALLFFLVIFLIIDAIIFIVLFSRRSSKNIALSDFHRKLCDDVRLDSSNKNCYFSGANKKGENNLLILGSIKQLNSANSLLIEAKLPYFSGNPTFKIIGRRIGNDGLFPLCKLSQPSIKNKEKCGLFKPSDINKYLSIDTYVVLEFHSGLEGDENYSKSCPDINKQFVSSFLNGDLKTLQNIQSGSCYPIVSQIYYY